MRLARGSMVGPNRIERRLGEGAMGVVFEATDTRDGRRVALKVLPPDVARGARAKRFEREFQVMKRLEHPGIARVFDAGMDAASSEAGAWYSMELIEGPTLGDRMRADAPLEELVRHVIAVARALGAAHAAGVIHRDVKPENVLIGADGRARLLDFGIARDVDALERLTRTNAIVGTPVFMAPEQILGRTADARADIYSLGAILHEAITRTPFRTGSVEDVLANATAAPRPPSAVRRDAPTIYDAACLRALAPDPAKRFPRASAFADALEAAGGGEPSTRRAPVLVGALLLAAGAGALGAALFVHARSGKEVLPPPHVTAAEKPAFAALLAKADELAARGDAGALDAARSARDAALPGTEDARRGAALLGALLEAKGDHAAALPLLEEAEPLGLPRALLALSRAAQALDTEHGERALSAARSAALAAKDDGELSGEAGALLLDLGRPDEATKVLERATALRPRDTRAHVNLGLARFANRDFAHAEDAFRAALDLEPTSLVARNGLGAVLVESQRFDEAVRLLTALVADDSPNASAWSNLARAERRLNHLAEAADAIAKARLLEPNEPAHACEAGRIALARLDLSAAEKAFQDAVRLEASNVEASVSLAAVLARQDRKDEARDVLEKIARIQPDDPSVKKALAELPR